MGHIALNSSELTGVLEIVHAFLVIVAVRKRKSFYLVLDEMMLCGNIPNKKTIELLIEECRTVTLSIKKENSYGRD